MERSTDALLTSEPPVDSRPNLAELPVSEDSVWVSVLSFHRVASLG